MRQLQIKVGAGRLDGSGIDMVGPFTLSGVLHEDGSVAILKHYIGQHSVDYLGEYDGEGMMTGHWRIGPDQGRWAIIFRRLKQGESTEIREISAKS